MDNPEEILERLRQYCLALPGTMETNAWGHPNFRAGKQIFVTYEEVKGKPSIAFRIDPDEIELFLLEAPFFATPYGRGKWVSMWLDGEVDWPRVENLALRSYKLVRP